MLFLNKEQETKSNKGLIPSLSYIITLDHTSEKRNMAKSDLIIKFPAEIYSCIQLYIATILRKKERKEEGQRVRNTGPKIVPHYILEAKFESCQIHLCISMLN